MDERLELHEDDIITVYTACFLVAAMTSDELTQTLHKESESGKLKTKIKTWEEVSVFANYCQALKTDLEEQELFREVIEERKKYLESNFVPGAV